MNPVTLDAHGQRSPVSPEQHSVGHARDPQPVERASSSSTECSEGRTNGVQVGPTLAFDTQIFQGGHFLIRTKLRDLGRGLSSWMDFFDFWHTVRYTSKVSFCQVSTSYSIGLIFYVRFNFEICIQIYAKTSKWHKTRKNFLRKLFDPSIFTFSIQLDRF